MTSNFEKLCAAISKQQEGHENTQEWWVGEQIKDICRGSEEYSGIILNDIGNKGMSVKDVEGKIKARAKKLGGCCPPTEADKIIREFYGLGAGADPEPAKKSAPILELASFLD